jgi:hypothetical protein
MSSILETIGASTKLATEILQEVARLAGSGLDDATCDALGEGKLWDAARCYEFFATTAPPPEWPLAAHLWVPTTSRADMVKSMALSLLEIIRKDRNGGW